LYRVAFISPYLLKLNHTYNLFHLIPRSYRWAGSIGGSSRERDKIRKDRYEQVSIEVSIRQAAYDLSLKF